MSSSAQASQVATVPGAQAVIATLLRCGINCGFGIPSIHNIPIYEVLRQAKPFHHWVVRHEQAAGYAADGYYRQSGRVAAVFASTGPGNLFTLVPLLESLQTNTPVLVIGTNIASVLQAGTGGALHETPQQLEIFRPLTRVARRVSSPDEIAPAIAEAAEMFRGPSPGPAFIEIPNDLLAAPASHGFAPPKDLKPKMPAEPALAEARRAIDLSQRPAILVGSGIHGDLQPVRKLAETLQAPVFTTTSGKGIFPADHALALGCISRLGAVQKVLEQSDLLISLGARLTEFDTGRFGLQFPARHIQVVEDAGYPGNRMPGSLVVGGVPEIAEFLAAGTKPRNGWCDIAGITAREKEQLQSLNADAYAALMLLRGALDRRDVVVNDQSILNYWASAFFPALEPGTFLYPSGSGTLGYALPAAVGAACAMQQAGIQQKVVCIAGDGGFQYTQHELATLAQYGLPVKILLVNDEAYGIIGFLQRMLFGQTYEVALKNPDFCRVAEAYGIPADRVTSLSELEQKLSGWLASSGPALLEWRTVLQAPWAVGAIPRPTGISMPPRT